MALIDGVKRDIERRVKRLTRRGEMSLLTASQGITRAIQGRLYSRNPTIVPSTSPIKEFQSLEFSSDDPWLGDEHPEHNLTPKRVVAYYADAENGQPHTQCRLFHG